MALVSALLGGGAVVAGSRMGRGGGAGGSRGLKRAAAIAGLVALSSLGLNAYQYVGQRDGLRNRLEATLIRPAPKTASGQSLDPALKEIPYAVQQSHPLGISTDEAEAIVRGVANGSRPDWTILDIRETAEAEMGTFKNAEKIRFPDLPQSQVTLASRKALLICHNGNRSAETCAALAEKGIDCRFIKGGLEKWLTEGRKLDGFSARSVDELRAIPDYPNHSTLLDTQEVRRLVAEDGAIFIDVRYPGEFAATHVPEAINLPLGPDAPPIGFAGLLHMALDIERRFGAAQDIEWAYARGKFWILQSRDITATSVARSDPHRAEWRRLVAMAGKEPVEGLLLVQTDMSEMLPRPTALSLSLLQKIWASGGGVDYALRALGLETNVSERAPPLYVTAFGRLYTDTREAAARAPRLNGLALRRIRRQGERIARDFRACFVPEFSKDMQLLQVVDFARLSLAELRDLLREITQRFATRTHADVDVINIAAQIYLDDARRGLEAEGLDPVIFLADFPRTALAEALHTALSAPAPHQAHLVRAAIGHRARCDYELAEPRYSEDVLALGRAASALSESDASRTATGGTSATASLKPGLAAMVARARTFQTLKEDAKHLALRELAQIRRLVLAIGEQSGLGDLVFHLTLDEVTALSPEPAAELKSTASQRRDTYQVLSAAPALATALTLADLERGPLPREAASSPGVLKGTRVSGSGTVEGRAVIVSHSACEAGEAIPGFMRGDILVAPMIHPAWLPEVVRAGGIVTEIGGWLSHMSIVAREHGIVKIVGVQGLSSIAHDTQLRLHPDGRIECLEPRFADLEVLAAE